MKHILLFGAGKSATSLIRFLVNLSVERSWKLTICDQDIEAIKIKSGNSKIVNAISLNVQEENSRFELIKSADIVISLLPAHLHFLVAIDCKNALKNLLTASYIDEKIMPFEKEIAEKNLLFLYEMGLDPGIDHMSAMSIIDRIKNESGNVTSFISHCGGLVAPKSDNNPWHYKITWNPRNVVLAGKDGAVYKENFKNISVTYNSIFRNCKLVDVPELTKLAWYPNRDSSRYINLYGLQETNTFIRTTLRYPQFCRGWSKLINIGITSIDDYEIIKHCKTYADWFNTKIKPYTDNDTNWNSYLQMYITDPFKDEFEKQMAFLGLQSKDLIDVPFNSSADILQSLMEKKLSLSPTDKDMIVMLHEIEYEKQGETFKVTSSLIVEGEDSLETAMAKTVGLPLGIATQLILDGKINEKGLKIPMYKDIYEPVLSSLKTYGISFNESTEKKNLQA